MKTVFSLCFNFLLGCFSQLVSQTSICINPDLPPNPDSKPGYYLVFKEDFSIIAGDVWNKSPPGNDWVGYANVDTFCNEAFSPEFGTPLNKSNAFPADDGSTTIAKLRTREGEDMGMCEHSAGEIKTFSGHEAENFRDWQLFPNSFIEARAKLPDCDGVGAAFWLWGGVQGYHSEIDVFELGGQEIDRFSTTYHYGKTSGTSQHPSRETFVNDMNGDDVNMGNKFLTWGVEFNKQDCKFYLNNVLFWGFPFYFGPGGVKEPYKVPLPKFVRLTTGSGLHARASACDELPKFFEVDQVRIWMKNGVKAITLKTPQTQDFCAVTGDGNRVEINHIPGVTHQWEPNPFFVFNPYDFNDPSKLLQSCSCQAWWVQDLPGTPPGLYH